jgi:hypothetical protein
MPHELPANEAGASGDDGAAVDQAARHGRVREASGDRSRRRARVRPSISKGKVGWVPARILGNSCR